MEHCQTCASDANALMTCSGCGYPHCLACDSRGKCQVCRKIEADDAQYQADFAKLLAEAA